MILDCPSCEHGNSVEAADGERVCCGVCGCLCIRRSYTKHYLARDDSKDFAHSYQVANPEPPIRKETK
jgi:hypothetical protein